MAAHWATKRKGAGFNQCLTLSERRDERRSAEQAAHRSPLV